ncbi:MAG: alpha/beta hydrolase [Parabacteroides sp.]
MNWIVICLWCCVLALQAADYKYERDICYRPTSTDTYIQEMCKLDVAYVPEAKTRPVIVWFHGGGLVSGHREIPEPLQAKDYVIVGVEYRFLPNVQTEAIIDDAAAAIAWVFDHIESYGGDPNQIYLSGHSAGGYLVSMVGLDKHWLEQYAKDADRLAGIIPYSGQAITHYETRKMQGIPALQPTIDSLAPLYHVRKDCAPMLIISGDREMELYGRYEEQAYLWRMLKLTGHPDVTLYELDGYDHGGMCWPGLPLLLKFIQQHTQKNK